MKEKRIFEIKPEVPEDIDQYMEDVIKSNKEHSISFTEVEHPILVLHDTSYDASNEIMRFEHNGDIYLHGKLIKNDLEVVEGFREWTKIQGYNYQETMLGKVEKLIKTIPNDMKLGKKVRNLFK